MFFQAHVDNIEVEPFTGHHRDASGTLRLAGKSARKTTKRKS
jgi:hypothetical protein